MRKRPSAISSGDNHFRKTLAASFLVTSILLRVIPNHIHVKKQGLSPNSTRRNFSLTRFLKVRFLAITIEKERTVCINEPNFIAVVNIFRITPCDDEFLNQPIIIVTSIEFNVQVFALTELHNQVGYVLNKSVFNVTLKMYRQKSSTLIRQLYS